MHLILNISLYILIYIINIYIVILCREPEFDHQILYPEKHQAWALSNTSTNAPYHELSPKINRHTKVLVFFFLKDWDYFPKYQIYCAVLTFHPNCLTQWGTTHGEIFIVPVWHYLSIPSFISQPKCPWSTEME